MPRGYDFAKELARYGPQGTAIPANLETAAEHCRQLTRTHYENFSVVSWFLPRRLIPAFEAVYAFCRWSDDLGDETGGPEQALPLLDWWKRSLEESWADPARATHPVFVALSAIRKDHALTIGPFQRLIAAFRRDQTQTRYESRAELLEYCHDSADPVGEIVLTLFGQGTEENIRLSDGICTGLQLANFWQDLSRDLDIGRIYLPREDCRRHGVDETDLWRRVATPPIQELVRDEVAWARSLLLSGASLPEKVGGTLGAQIRLFLEGGLAILALIEKQGYRSLERRPKLTKWDKGRLLAGALWNRFMVRWFPTRALAPLTKTDGLGASS